MKLDDYHNGEGRSWARDESVTDHAMRELGSGLDRDPEEFRPWMVHEWLRADNDS